MGILEIAKASVRLEYILSKKDSSVKLFEERVSPIYTEIYRYVYAIVGEPQMAQDALQSALLSAFEHRNDLRDPSRFKWWLLRIAQRAAFTELRRNKRGNVSIEAAGFDYLPSTDVSPEDSAEREEMVQQVMDMLAGKGEQTQRIFVLKHWHGLTFQQIGEIMRLNTNTVKTRYFRAREQLESQMRRMGYMD